MTTQFKFRAVCLVCIYYNKEKEICTNPPCENVLDMTRNRFCPVLINISHQIINYKEIS